MKKKIIILLVLLLSMFFLFRYLDIHNDISKLDEEISKLKSTLVNENEISELKYNDIVQYYKDELNNEMIISENRMNSINNYIEKETEFKHKINELKESVKLLSSSDYYISNLNLYGITSEMVLQDLSTHPELIPFEGVLGGTMGWSVSESYLLTDRFVFAQFNDGHYLGHALLRFEVINDNITWNLFDAEVFNDELTGQIFLGESVYSDLNGDGDFESITYDLDDLKVNGNSWRRVIKDDVYNDNPHKEKYILVDIDISDSQKEIGLMVEGPSSDYMTHFYSYDGVNLLELGSVPFHVENLKDQLDEEGNIYGYMRLNVLQTWFAEARWTLIDNRLVLNHEGMYDVSFDRVHNLMVDLPIYKNMGDEQTYAVMLPQEVQFLQTDNMNWCQLEGEDGSKGWFKLEGHGKLPDVNLYPNYVFDNLNFAD